MPDKALGWLPLGFVEEKLLDLLCIIRDIGKELGVSSIGSLTKV